MTGRFVKFLIDGLRLKLEAIEEVGSHEELLLQTEEAGHYLNELTDILKELLP